MNVSFISLLYASKSLFPYFPSVFWPIDPHDLLEAKIMLPISSNSIQAKTVIL